MTQNLPAYYVPFNPAAQEEEDAAFVSNSVFVKLENGQHLMRVLPPHQDSKGQVFVGAWRHYVKGKGFVVCAKAQDRTRRSGCFICDAVQQLAMTDKAGADIADKAKASLSFMTNVLMLNYDKTSRTVTAMTAVPQILPMKKTLKNKIFGDNRSGISFPNPMDDNYVDFSHPIEGRNIWFQKLSASPWYDDVKFAPNVEVPLYDILGPDGEPLDLDVVLSNLNNLYAETILPEEEEQVAVAGMLLASAESSSAPPASRGRGMVPAPANQRKGFNAL